MARTLPLLLALVVTVPFSGCVHAEKARSPAAQPAANGNPTLARLRARPLQLPSMPRGTCQFPPSLSSATELVPGRPGEAALGNGPVYAAFRAIPRLLDAFAPEMAGLAPSSWGSGETVWISEPDYRGAVLVRGRRIDGPGRIGFGPAAIPSSELFLPAGMWAERTAAFRRWTRAARNGWRFAAERTRIHADGCYAFQIDGESFSDVIVFGAKLQP